MTEEDERRPLLPADENEQDENNLAKSSLFSWFFDCFPRLRNKRTTAKENCLTKSLDEFSCPVLNQMNLEEYFESNGYTKLFEEGNIKIYYIDLHVGHGKAVLMEAETDFDVQKVKYHYDRYNLSAKLIATNKTGSKRSPVIYRFCEKGCEGLGIGLQGMQQGGIRRYIVNHPPKHKFSVLPNPQVLDYVIFHIQLLEVDKSCACKIRKETFPGI